MEEREKNTSRPWLLLLKDGVSVPLWESVPSFLHACTQKSALPPKKMTHIWASSATRRTSPSTFAGGALRAQPPSPNIVAQSGFPSWSKFLANYTFYTKDTYALVEFSPVLVGAGVCPALVLGVHADLGLWVRRK